MPALACAVLIGVAAFAPGEGAADEDTALRIERHVTSPFGSEDLLSVRSTDVPARLRVGVTVAASHDEDALRFYVVGNPVAQQAAIVRRTTVTPALTVSWPGWAHLAVALPIVVAQEGAAAPLVPLPPLPGTAVGDLLFSAKLRPFAPRRGLGFGLALDLRASTASSPLLGEATPTATPWLLADLTRDIGPVRILLAVNAGLLLRPEGVVADIPRGSELLLKAGLAIQIRVGRDRVDRLGLQVEALGATSLNTPFGAPNVDAFQLLAGISYTMGWRGFAAAGVEALPLGSVGGYGVPSAGARARAGLAFEPGSRPRRPPGPAIPPTLLRRLPDVEARSAAESP